MISIDGENEAWKINAGRKLKLYSPEYTQMVPRLELEVGKIYLIALQKGRKGYIFIESYTKDRCTFKKYTMQPNNTINIGKRLHHSSILHAGDALYILGVKIVLGYQFLALNNPDNIKGLPILKQTGSR